MKTETAVFTSGEPERLALSEQEGAGKRKRGRVFKRGRTWWMQYSLDGQQVRESCRTTYKQTAESKLVRKLAEIDAGIAQPPNAGRLTYEEMRDALYADYRINGRKWLRTAKNGKTQYVTGIPRLDKFFKGWRAMRVSTAAIRKYVRTRQEDAAANGTVNRELALLRRMFTLAVEDKKLRFVPHFPMLKEAAPRKGFLEHAGYQKLRQELPEHLRAVLAMGYYSGMRLGEVISLKWEDVSLSAGEIHLEADATKTGEPRTVPLANELLEMLKIARQKSPQAERVFLNGDSEPIRTFYKAWRSAAERAGLGGLLFHDLRRTGVRNLVRAGVPEKVAMAISGHKTRAVFDRYNIVSGRDLKDAAAKLDAYLLGQIGDNSGTISPMPVNRERGAVEETARIQ